jgi:CDP-diacylglycerol--serine O-phosphatidyltransferase
MYEWSLRGLGRWGWAAAFIYVAGAALRLARFNTNIAVVDTRFFQGIPSPAAAALVVGFVWVFSDLRYVGTDLEWPSWIITVYAGLTMVSNSPFFSFKVFDVKKSVPAIVLVLVVLVFAAVSSDPPKWLFGLFMVYGISGHVLWLWRRAHHRTASPVRRAE